MERKHFLSLLGLGVAGVSFGKVLKNRFSENSNVLVLFVGEYIPEAVYNCAIETGFNCCQILANKKGISKRSDMENLILGNEITDYECVNEEVNFYWITKETAELAARESEKEIKEFLGRGFTDIVFVANFECSTAVGALKRILMYTSNPKIEIHSVVNYSWVWDEEEMEFQKFILKCFSKNSFYCNTKLHPDYDPMMNMEIGQEFDAQLFLNEFKACLKKVDDEKK